MRIGLSLYLGLIAVSALPAQAQPVAPAVQTVYEGTIGKAAVVLEIVRSGQMTTAQYFYGKYHLSIPLNASGPSGFEERASCYQTQCPLVGKWQLRSTGTGLSGQWLGQTGRKPVLTVTLKKVAERRYTPVSPVTQSEALRSALSYDDPGAAADNPYLSRLYDSGRKDGTEVVRGDYAVRPVSDRLTGVTYPRLTRAPAPRTLMVANRILDGRRFNLIDGALMCLGEDKNTPGGGTSGGYDETESDITYLTPTIMTIREAGSTYCGGAHPNNFWSLTTYDLTTGAPLDFNRVLKLTQTAKAGEDAIDTADYAALKAKLTPQSAWFVGSEDVSECLSDDLGYGYSLSFSDKGLVFSLTDLPHVMGVCMGEYYVIPYSELKSLWRPAAKTYFPKL